MTTFVLVPGAGGDTLFWHRLVAELERRGHEALPVELPVRDDSAGLAAYADRVVEVVGDRSPVVLVAQSMGGLTAPLVCERVPVQLLVLLNAMVPLPGETGGEWWSVTGQGEAAAAYRQSLGLPADLDEDATYFHDVPPEVVARYTDQEFAQSGRPFEDPWPLDRWPDVPTRVVAGRDDRLFPVDFQRKVAAERLGLDVDEVPGGHCAALSRPVELADLLESYLGSREGPR
ncbi:alpha/beta fold hydrolase [Blastococcus litoris]|uniref:alpha/beta fold hydrolase n=1 Tax=Blastococcus litoris TaxID=2171622 RepID=UPI000E308D1E|nr:alpha/beta hydrolase [Blastococcus litoris]